MQISDSTADPPVAVTSALFAAGTAGLSLGQSLGRTADPTTVPLSSPEGLRRRQLSQQQT